ncbi:MAG: LIC_10190 family membrane protein [Chitinophagales bacterium]
MLLLFCLHIIITIISSLSGFLFYLFLKDKTAQNKPLIFYPFMGLIAITLISQIAVLFIPVNFYFSLSFLFLVLLLSFIKRNEIIFFYKRILSSIQGLSIPALLFIGITWLMILVINSGPIIMDDTDSYHLQMVKWVHEYGTVPGIANLHERFGFNSSWFSSISFFLFFNSKHNVYTALNGTISFWLSSFLIGQLNFLFDFKKTQRISSLNIAMTVVFLALLFCWPMFRGNSANANYDFIATALTLILFLKTIPLSKQTNPPIFYLEWILWPVYLFTVRIINYPLLLLSLYGFYFLLKNREWKKITIDSIVCLLLMLPFIARNVVLSGYPFYPATFANIFNVDWKVDRSTINALLDYIKYFNRVNTTFADISQTKQLNFPGWTISWFRYLFNYDKLIFVIGISGYLLNFVSIKRFFRLNNRYTRFFVLVFCLQLISWMWVAPDPRFVYGELLCGIILLIIFLFNNRSFSPGNIKPVYFFIILFTGIFLYTSLKPAKNENYREFVLPYKIPQPPAREVMLDHISLKIPEKILNNWNPRCYSTELPCLYIIDPKLRARGKSIKNGFRLEK